MLPDTLQRKVCLIVDTEKLYAATQHHLMALVRGDHLPPDALHQGSRERLAFMHGCAIMAEACGLDGARWLRDELPKRSKLILPAGVRLT